MNEWTLSSATTFASSISFVFVRESRENQWWTLRSRRTCFSTRQMRPGLTVVLRYTQADFFLSDLINTFSKSIKVYSRRHEEEEECATAAVDSSRDRFQVERERAPGHLRWQLIISRAGGCGVHVNFKKVAATNRTGPASVSCHVRSMGNPASGYLLSLARFANALFTFA